jgi:hypothetical protein
MFAVFYGGQAYFTFAFEDALPDNFFLRGDSTSALDS